MRSAFHSVCSSACALFFVLFDSLLSVWLVEDWTSSSTESTVWSVSCPSVGGRSHSSVVLLFPFLHSFVDFVIIDYNYWKFYFSNFCELNLHWKIYLRKTTATVTSSAAFYFVFFFSFILSVTFFNPLFPTASSSKRNKLPVENFPRLVRCSSVLFHCHRGKSQYWSACWQLSALLLSSLVWWSGLVVWWFTQQVVFHHTNCPVFLLWCVFVPVTASNGIFSTTAIISSINTRILSG